MQGDPPEDQVENSWKNVLAVARRVQMLGGHLPEIAVVTLGAQSHCGFCAALRCLAFWTGGWCVRLDYPDAIFGVKDLAAQRERSPDSVRVLGFLVRLE